MDSTTILTIIGPIVFAGILVFVLLKFKKYEALTYAEFFMKDRNGPYLHILGARRIMPDEGESFDIFEHYVLDLNQLKFIKGASQKGKNLNLQSEFVKRSMAQLSQKLNVQLEFLKTSDDYDDEKDGVLRVYRFEEMQSDTEVIEEMSGDSLVFVKGSGERDHFKMMINRNGQTLRSYEMNGMSDYFFKTIYLEDKGWLCFLYRKEKTILKSGMAVCIINYNTGELIFDGFVQPARA